MTIRSSRRVAPPAATTITAQPRRLSIQRRLPGPSKLSCCLDTRPACRATWSRPARTSSSRTTNKHGRYPKDRRCAGRRAASDIQVPGIRRRLITANTESPSFGSGFQLIRWSLGRLWKGNGRGCPQDYRDRAGHLQSGKRGVPQWVVPQCEV